MGGTVTDWPGEADLDQTISSRSPFLDPRPMSMTSATRIATIARNPTTTRVRLRPARRIRS
jgi:hypothetical protein